MIEYINVSFPFVVRMMLSIFYFFSGALKLFSIGGFARALQHYHVFPKTLTETIAYLLPLLEIVISILLFTQSYLFAILIIVLLLQLFLVYFTAAALREKGHVKNSGMFGSAFKIALSLKIVLINIILLIGAGYLLLQMIMWG